MQQVEIVERPRMVYGDEVLRCVSRRGGSRDGARGRSGGSPIKAFTPASMPSIAHWYRADAANVTLDGSNNVSQWNDLIGSAHLVQATSGNRPAYNATDAAYNNQATIQASAASKWMAAAGVSTAQTCTIWLVGEWSTGDRFIVALGAAGSGKPILYRDSTDGTVIATAGVALDGNVTSNTKRAVLAKFAGASSFVGVSNWLTAGVSGNAGTGAGTAISVFGDTSGNAGSLTVGKLAEVIIQSGAPTAGEKTAMAAYFLSRYGITVT